MREPEVSEWVRQAEYDYEDTEYLFLGKRYPKAIFCCHLALEKGLKAHYIQVQPPGYLSNISHPDNTGRSS
ncbi:HEPN domain-containing protein [Methanospirillum lacunae]|uniref:HEPN domain-containing protein n=1 Tax=Methanospirillum lacunae TaxID=668570 RepID=A0A2V2N7H1_9EURY|nr:hypothetical protein DK846_00465 [Methanospirillum lacunae]